MPSLWVSYVSELTLIGNLSYTVPNSSASADGSRSGHIWISTGIHCDYHALANPGGLNGSSQHFMIFAFGGGMGWCCGGSSRVVIGGGG
jgi:hypothetical protein